MRERAVVAIRVRRLVEAEQRDAREGRAVRDDVRRRHARDVLVERDPAVDVAAPVRVRRARERARVAAEALAARGAATEHAHRVPARRRELEERRVRRGRDPRRGAAFRRRGSCGRTGSAGSARASDRTSGGPGSPDGPGKRPVRKGAYATPVTDGNAVVTGWSAPSARRRASEGSDADAPARVPASIVSKRAPSATSRMSDMLTSAATSTLATSGEWQLSL